MEKYSIGFVDINPNTGHEYPFVKICETYTEEMCNWVAGTLTRDLWEHSDDPNREIKIIWNKADQLIYFRYSMVCHVAK